MRLGRLAAAAGLVLMGGLGSPGPVAACSMVAPSVDEVLAAAKLVFEGEVTAVDGQRLTVDLTEVYRGDVAPGVTVLGSDAPPTACTVSVALGQTIIVATVSLDELGLFGVWWVLEDGTLGTLAPEPPARTADEFRAVLRGLPDTAIAGTSATATIGLISLAAATGLALAQRRATRSK